MDQFGDPLQQPALVHLYGDLGDDDALGSPFISSIVARARI